MKPGFVGLVWQIKEIEGQQFYTPSNSVKQIQSHLQKGFLTYLEFVSDNFRRFVRIKKITVAKGVDN